MQIFLWPDDKSCISALDAIIKTTRQSKSKISGYNNGSVYIFRNWYFYNILFSLGTARFSIGRKLDHPEIYTRPISNTFRFAKSKIYSKALLTAFTFHLSSKMTKYFVQNMIFLAKYFVYFPGKSKSENNPNVEKNNKNANDAKVNMQYDDIFPFSSQKSRQTRKIAAGRAGETCRIHTYRHDKSWKTKETFLVVTFCKLALFLLIIL